MDSSLSLRNLRMRAWFATTEKRKKLILLALLEFVEDPQGERVLSERDLHRISRMSGVAKKTVRMMLLHGFVQDGERHNTLGVAAKETERGIAVRFTLRPIAESVPYPEFVPQFKDAPGLVYLIRAGAFYKIGRTQDIDARVRSIQTGCPHNVEVVSARMVSDAAAYEQYLHERYKQKRRAGEWFDLNKLEAGAIARALQDI